MIQANELRLDNLIYNGIGEVFKVNPQTIANFYGSSSILGAFKPIPLTEQWLIDFGYEYERGFYTDGNGETYFGGELHDEKGFYFYLGEWNFIDRQYPLKYIKYVHQLQNLIFALTGKELELKIL